MKIQDIKLKNLENKKIPYMKSGVKSSANFFDHKTDENLRYQFETKQNKNIKNPLTDSSFVHHKIKKPVKKHGIKFYAGFVILASVGVMIFSIIYTYSQRYQNIKQSYNECVESVNEFVNLDIDPEVDTCKNYPTNIFSSEYIQTGLNSGQEINNYNQVIERNESKLKSYENQWQTTALELQKEFEVLRSSDTTELNLNQVFPQDSLPLGTKLNNGQIQLSIIKEKNKEILDDINNKINEISNKSDLYKNQINTVEYTTYAREFDLQSDDDKIANYQDIVNKFEEFESYTEDQLERIKREDDETALELEIKSYKQFTGEDFYQLYEGYIYKFVNDVEENIVITGDPDVDAYIENKAVERGYKKRFTAYENRLEQIEGQLLMPEARESYERMKLAAQKEGINLVLVSGYRAPLTQKSIFNNRFGGVYSPQDILAGIADNALDTVLSTSSIPGYSKHHTGYTLDIGCLGSNFVFFKDTECFQWVSKNNYLNAKKFGFIPSYPENTISKQGPNPEEWEYTWVDQEILKSTTSN